MYEAAMREEIRNLSLTIEHGAGNLSRAVEMLAYAVEAVGSESRDEGALAVAESIGRLADAVHRLMDAAEAEVPEP